MPRKWVFAALIGGDTCEVQLDACDSSVYCQLVVSSTEITEQFNLHAAIEKETGSYGPVLQQLNVAVVYLACSLIVW